MFQKNLEKLIEIQNGAVKFVKEKKRVVLNWETGVGKTLPALRSTEEIGGRWLWIMSQNIQEDNVKKEIAKFGIKSNIIFVNYLSLKNYVGRFFSGVVLDEAHRLTESSAYTLSDIVFEHAVALSASIPPDRMMLLKETLKLKKASVSRITMKQAIKYGILPPVNIIGVEIDIDSDTDLHYHTFKRFKNTPPEIINGYAEYLTRTFIPGQFTVINCTLAEKLKIVESEMDFWNEQYKKKYMDPKAQWMKNTRWMPLGGLRKSLLAELKNRYMPIVQEHLEGKRYVVFNENIKQIEDNEGVKIHSNIKKKDNLGSIEAFNSGETNVLQVAKMLNEGINLKDIDAVVILALTSVDIQNIQRRGRSVRGENPTVYVMYVKGTHDEKKFHKFIEEYKDTTSIVKINQLLNL